MANATHTPGAALNEDSLAGPKLKGILDYNQCGETGNCQSGSLDMAKARGFPGDDVGLDSDLLGVRTLLTDIAHGKYRIPGRNSATPSPSALTTPEKSRPNTWGNCAWTYRDSPVRTFQSAALTLAA